MVVREQFANSESGESDSHRLAVLSVFTRIVKGHEFDLLKFESSLYTIRSHVICAIRVFLYSTQATDGQICGKYDLILRIFYKIPA